jgi:hypothetical protein
MRVVVKALMVSPVHWPPFKTPEAGTLLKPQRHRDQNTETQGQRGKKKETSQRELLLQSPTGMFGKYLEILCMQISCHRFRTAKFLLSHTS